LSLSDGICGKSCWISNVTGFVLMNALVLRDRYLTAEVP
jgi:hypothetical protein